MGRAIVDQVLWAGRAAPAAFKGFLYGLRSEQPHGASGIVSREAVLDLFN